MSVDGGLSWFNYPGVMGEIPITALAAYNDQDETRLYIGTVGGTFSGAVGVEPMILSQDILGAGVYMGYSRVFLTHLPMIIQAP